LADGGWCLPGGGLGTIKHSGCCKELSEWPTRIQS